MQDRWQVLLGIQQEKISELDEQIRNLKADIDQIKNVLRKPLAESFELR